MYYTLYYYIKHALKLALESHYTKGAEVNLFFVLYDIKMTLKNT